MKILFGRFLQFTFILMVFNSCSTEDDSCKDVELESAKVVLIAGQSNTHYGLGFDADLDAPASNVYQLGRFDNDNCVIQACEPLDHHTRTVDRIGFGLKFAKLLSSHFEDSENILIVPCGYGGTGFIDKWWNKGDALYQDAVQRMRTVKDKIPNSELVAVLWHQGETDAILQNSNFQENLDSFIVNLRADLDHDYVPFILGGMVPYWVDQSQELQEYQDILKQTPERIPNSAYVDPDEPFRISKPDDTFDDIHYDAAGQRELGKRYFEEFRLLTE